MPNETLITQLDSLRDGYIQQQKAITAVQAAFKAHTDAQNKMLKALKDYNAALDISIAQNAFAQSRLKEEVIDPLVPDLRRELKTVTTVIGALKDSSVALRGEPVDVIKLDKGVSLLRASNQQNLVDLLLELTTEIELAQLALSDEFGQKLRDAFAQQGVIMTRSGSKFVIGRFELEANFSKRFIVLRYGKDVVVPRVPVTVDAALKAYQSASKLIIGRNQEGKSWIARFYEAYQNLQRKQGGDNSRINIVDCYVEFVVLNQGRNFFSEPSKRTFKDYSRAEFIYDFYEFADQQRLNHNGQVVKAHSAMKSQTDNPARSMWIVEGDSPYDGRYIADIEWENA
jgi:hypothetical protein